MGVRARKDIRQIQAQYDAGDKTELENLIRAWQGIQKLPADDKKSLFMIAGYHGEPFRGAGWGNPSWWGGYCNHGNVLFPVWHRAYIIELEKALQSIPKCADVMLPYWDETDKETANTGIPKIFLRKTFPLDGEDIPNPLYSYTFQNGVYDNLSTIPDHDYTKPPGYTTVRYPWAGLVGNADDVSATEVHNQTLENLGDDAVNNILNSNVKNWLGFSVTASDGTVIYTGNREKYAKCLEAPNYTVFSNTTSAQQWNEDHFGVKAWREEGAPKQAPDAVVPLESPHNALHLAIGGFEVPGYNANNWPGASGDMGENDTASFDPIFYFHHCFIDKKFWEWQEKWESTTTLDVIPGYPGTNSVDSQGPTPGVPGNTWLDMDSPLQPFYKVVWPLSKGPYVIKPGSSGDAGGGTSSGELPDNVPIARFPPVDPPPAPYKVYLTGKDMVNITKLGYKYASYTPDATTSTTAATVTSSQSGSGDSSTPPTPLLRIPPISRANIAGSFLISTWANDKLIDVEPVLSRWHVAGCENCGTHLSVKTFVPLYGLTPKEAKEAKVQVLLHTRDNREGVVKFKAGKLGDHIVGPGVGGGAKKLLLGHIH